MRAMVWNPEALSDRRIQNRLFASIAVFLAAAVSRAIWAYHYRVVTFHGIEAGWGEIGNIAFNLYQGRGFSFPFGIGSQPTAWECPIVPFIFASVMKMSGGANLQAARFLLCIQCAVGAAGATLFWLIIQLLSESNPGLFARWLSPAAAATVCFWPDSLFSATYLWDYVWQEAALALFLFVALLWSERATLTLSVLVGLSGSVLTLINLTPAPIVLSVVLFMVLRRRVDPRALKLSVIAGLCFVAGVGPWVTRNLTVFHTYVPLRSNAGYELFGGNNPIECIRAPNNAPHPATDSRERQMYVEMGEIRYCRFSFHRAIQYIQAHPGQTAVRIADRIYVTWFTDLSDHWIPYPELPWWKRTRISQLRYVASAALIVFSVACFFWGFIGGRFALLPYRHMFAAVLIFLPLPHYLTVADPPYTATFRLCVAITSLSMMALRPERTTSQTRYRA